MAKNHNFAPSSPVVRVFPRFAYAVPLACAEALALSRFEEGDIFYNDVLAYTDWPAWLSRPGPGPVAIQVREPRRDTTASVSAAPGHKGGSGAEAGAGGDEDAQRGAFQSNWCSDLKLEWHDFSGARQFVSTTQGRLFCCLWKGDLAILDRGRAAKEPSPPWRMSEVLGKLDELDRQQLFASRGVRRAIVGPDADSEAIDPDTMGDVVVSVCDQSQENSRRLCDWFREVLRAHERQESLWLWAHRVAEQSTDRANEDWLDTLSGRAHPAIDLCMHRLPGTFENIRASLEKSFFGRFPGKEFKQAQRNMFRLYARSDASCADANPQGEFPLARPGSGEGGGGGDQSGQKAARADARMRGGHRSARRRVDADR